MNNRFKIRRLYLLIILISAISYFIIVENKSQDNTQNKSEHYTAIFAIDKIDELKIRDAIFIKEYKRDYFGKDWGTINGCDTRNVVLYRDLKNLVTDGCNVLSGELLDPYTGKNILFQRGENTSSIIQIDHVVALSDAWIKGGFEMTHELRLQFANDPLELLAVSGSSNQKKSGSDASEWLPENVSYRCEYVSRQIAIKLKYNLFVSKNEKHTFEKVLSRCKDQKLPGQ